MRTVCLTLIAGFFGTTTLSAQSAMGLKLGFNLASIELDPGTEANSDLFGLTGGLQLEHRFGQHVRMAPELIFIQKGQRDDRSYGGYKADYRLYLNYVELPLLFKYRLGGKKLAFLPGAGLSVGYLMNGKEWIRFYTRKDDEVHKEDVDLEEAHIARVDVGLCFSGGFALDGRSGGGLRLEARYQLGLSNLDESGYDSAKNRGWCIGAVYLFPLDPNNGKGQAGAPVTPVPLK